MNYLAVHQAAQDANVAFFSNGDFFINVEVAAADATAYAAAHNEVTPPSPLAGWPQIPTLTTREAYDLPPIQARVNIKRKSCRIIDQQ